VRRFQIPKAYVKRAIWGTALLALLMAVAVWDYWRVRSDNVELDGLRVESAEQREQIESFRHTLATAQAELERVRELERKVRIIANLPGAQASGGEAVIELVPEGEEDEQALLPPAGVPLGLEAPPGAEPPLSQTGPQVLDPRAPQSPGGRDLVAMAARVDAIEQGARLRGLSLDSLVLQLEEKSKKLASLPSVWPTRGWLTSRFGPRISPFTGKRQLHAGIDIATREGTPIVAPARGRVSFVGKRGPLGNTLSIDHGFGVKTTYGHTQKVGVKAGDEVGRGQVIAWVGSSGRSTGPHLHYVVEVGGKARNPLDYIFD